MLDRRAWQFIGWIQHVNQRATGVAIALCVNHWRRNLFPQRNCEPTLHLRVIHSEAVLLAVKCESDVIGTEEEIDELMDDVEAGVVSGKLHACWYGHGRDFLLTDESGEPRPAGGLLASTAAAC